MDYFILFGLLGFGGMIIGFIGYKVVTGNIIKDLERENEILKTDNERLRTALRAKRPAQDPRVLFIGSRATSKDAFYLEKLKKQLESGVILKPDNYFKEF